MQYTSGVVVTTRQGMGRVLQASREFAPGDLVLREEALLSYVNEMPYLYDGFMALPSQEQQQVLDLHRLRYGETARFTSCEQRMAYIAAEIAVTASDAAGAAVQPINATNPLGQAVQDFTYRMMYKLCSMAQFNAHDATLLPWQEESIARMQAQLPPEARKLEVSAVFRVATRFYAVHPITAGDLITIAYKSWNATPTLERWTELARSKDFVCTCLRCADGVVMPTFSLPPQHARELPELEDAAWRCDACGAAPDSVRLAAQLAEAARMEARALALANMHLLSDESILESAVREKAELRQLMARARAELCGTHRVLSVAARSLAALHDARYADLLKYYADTVGVDKLADAQLRDVAALRLLRLGLKECAAAGCTRRGGAASCARLHPVAANGGAIDLARGALATISMLQDSTAFVRKQKQENPTDVERLARYVPLLACLLSARNNEVLAAAALLDLPLPRCAEPAGSSAAAVALLTCGGCGLLDYCSRSCQRRHWKKCHKKVCKKVAAWAGRLEGRNGNSSGGGSV
ncbi:hypothetical protein JKP88DRAFT_274443 [Tribonema minus]|uniref:MYND-type domain-containing protein n=1 Tax=Tribonema minus TaxID=303371 RepID=A0A835YJF2_9STRA|nr:hypothetical protein JKP88DRAFT_274443 [Tribonema minus]